MESFYNDDLALPVVEESSHTLLKPKLKRLKKAAPSSLPHKLAADVRVVDALDMLILPAVPVPIEIRTSSSDAMRHEDFDMETRPATDLDPLFVYRSIEEDAPSVAERGGKDDMVAEDKEAVDVVESKKEKTPKRRLSFVDDDDDTNKKKKKMGSSRKLAGQNVKPKETAREKRKLEKARKVELEHLHAESQRLLRETRDASFKPAHLIQKPISSVLEKIRLRKLEMFKRHSSHSWMPSIADSDCPDMSACNSDPVNSQSELKQADDNAKASDVGPKSAYQNPTSDTEVDKKLNNADNNFSNTLEACSLPISSLKIDGVDNHYVAASVGGSNVSSSEESDKENIGPRASKYVNMDSPPKDGLAKAFLDDEAEEEDDSDGDLLRFQEVDEEDETDEHEELADLIATGNEEAPIDQEKRNELHQKWLEHQDATETENVLQRLKYRQGFGGSSFIHGDSHCYDGSDDDDDDDDNDINGNCDDENTLECDDEAAYKHHTILAVHQGLKKAKQMITQMFTDANDVYIPSDDEENEKNFIRNHILKKNEEPSIISPVEDENSREFFGLIKKLNIAPATKKRGKASASVFDSLIVPGNSNSSSKSSFLNRASSSLPSSHKQGSSLIKTFIFGRDDSNSRSNFSTTEINSDLDQNGNSTAKNVITDKISSSQRKSSISKRKVQADPETGSSLFNILRQSSIKFESKDYDGSHVITESQTAHKFSAFKLRRTSKLE